MSASTTRVEVKTHERIVRVTQVGNGRYLAFARVLPFLHAGDIVHVVAYIYSDKDWYVEIRPYDGALDESKISKVAARRRTKGR